MAVGFLYQYPLWPALGLPADYLSERERRAQETLDRLHGQRYAYCGHRGAAVRHAPGRRDLELGIGAEPGVVCAGGSISVGLFLPGDARPRADFAPDSFQE